MAAAFSKTVLTALAAVLIIVAVFSQGCQNTQAQTQTTFQPTDEFAIPQLNGSISFSLNGSCSASLENDTWVFKDLTLNTSQPLGTLKISAQDCSVTVHSFRAQNLSGRSALVRLTVEGTGKQTVNLGLNASLKTSPYEWSVVLPGGVFLAEGEGWHLLPDNTVVMSGLTGNMSVIHYSFSFPDDSNLPFYMRHSVAILTVAVLAAVISVAVVVKVRGRK